MDLTVIRSKAISMIKRFRYVLLILAAGIVLMMLPEKNTSTKEPSSPETGKQEAFQTIDEAELSQLLQQIRGVGKAEVFLTCSAGEKIVYQTDQRSNHADNSISEEYDTVILTDSSRGETGMIQQILGPEYLGAVIVCQGADDPAVRLAVSEAVGKATGLGSNRISVLKMK